MSVTEPNSPLARRLWRYYSDGAHELAGASAGGGAGASAGGGSGTTSRLQTAE